MYIPRYTIATIAIRHGLMLLTLGVALMYVHTWWTPRQLPFLPGVCEVSTSHPHVVDTSLLLTPPLPMMRT